MSGACYISDMFGHESYKTPQRRWMRQFVQRDVKLCLAYLELSWKLVASFGQGKCFYNLPTMWPGENLDNVVSL